MQVLVVGAGVIGLAVARTAALAGHDVTVAEIRPLAPSLEDVFVELTYRQQAQSEAQRA